VSLQGELLLVVPWYFLVKRLRRLIVLSPILGREALGSATGAG